MSGIGQVLTSEIRRLARREAKALVGPLHKTLTQLRREIWRITRENRGLERKLAAVPKVANGLPVVDVEEGKKGRVGPRLIAKLRNRLGLSQGEFATILDVSSNSISNWEQGHSQPNAAMKAKILAARQLGRRAALRLLDEKTGAPAAPVSKKGVVKSVKGGKAVVKAVAKKKAAKAPAKKKVGKAPAPTPREKQVKLSLPKGAGKAPVGMKTTSVPSKNVAVAKTPAAKKAARVALVKVLAAAKGSGKPGKNAVPAVAKAKAPVKKAQAPKVAPGKAKASITPAKKAVPAKKPAVKQSKSPAVVATVVETVAPVADTKVTVPPVADVQVAPDAAKAPVAKPAAAKKKSPAAKKAAPVKAAAHVKAEAPAAAAVAVDAAATAPAAVDPVAPAAASDAVATPAAVAGGEGENKG